MPEFSANQDIPLSYDCEVPQLALGNKNLRMVVCVVDHATGNVLNCAVAPVSGDVGIGNVNRSLESGQTLYYDLQGRRISNPSHGIYVRVRDGKADKVRM